jgi:hypothetical protein
MFDHLDSMRMKSYISTVRSMDWECGIQTLGIKQGHAQKASNETVKKVLYTNNA